MQVMLMCCIDERPLAGAAGGERDADHADYGAWVADLERAGKHVATEKLARVRGGEDPPAAGRQGSRDRRALRRDQGTVRRFPHPRVPRPGRGAGDCGADPDAAGRRHDRGPARGARRLIDFDARLPRRIAPRARDADPPARRLRSGRGGDHGGIRGGHRAVAARRRAGEPARLARVRRPLQGDRRHPPAGAIRHRARRSRGQARGRRQRPGGCARRDAARRPVASRLHLLPPRARAGRAGGDDAARSLRAHHRGDRERLPRAAGDAGAAHRARQGEDPRRGDSLPGAGARRASRAPRCGAARRIPGVQRGLRGLERRDAHARRSFGGGDQARPAAARAASRARDRGPRSR